MTVKFARSETDRTKAMREKSYGFMLKKNAEEPWIQTRFYQLNSEESMVLQSISMISLWYNVLKSIFLLLSLLQLEKNRLLCSKPENTVHNLTLPKDKYITNLIGPGGDVEEFQKQPTVGSLSMFQIRKLPQQTDRIKHFMANGKNTSSAAFLLH